MPRLMSKKEAAAYIGVHAEHVMRMARQGRFPKPIKLGASENSAVRFVVEEVEAWVATRMAEREGQN
jgi:excisionase family DNA binding protein